jgi:hypothetical protein
MSESETLLVDSLYAEVIGAVKLGAALSASSPELISILRDIKSEARCETFPCLWIFPLVPIGP